MKIKLSLCLLIAMSLSACVTRVKGSGCPPPSEYEGEPVATIINDSLNIIKRPSEKKAIAFGVFGKKALYLDGVSQNIDQAKEFFPGWTVVVYVDPVTVPAEKIKEYRDKGATVKEDPSYNHASARFYVADMDFDRFIVRDADSRFYPREIAAVADWMKADWAFVHGMRDAASASDPLQAGMWGAITKPLREKLLAAQGTSNMEALYIKFMDGKKAVYGDDQKFLADIVVKSVGYEHFMSHESVDCHAFPNSRGFPISKGISPYHIGTRNGNK
jgi:hypothetical protein